jgi:hypothetical protein
MGFSEVIWAAPLMKSRSACFYESGPGATGEETGPEFYARIYSAFFMPVWQAAIQIPPD